MHLCMAGRAAIADVDQTIIQIAGVANGRQHNAACGDTGDTSVSMPLALLGNVSRSVPTNRPMRCLTTIGSPSRAAAAGWIAVPSGPGHRHSVLLALSARAEQGVTRADLRDDPAGMRQRHESPSCSRLVPRRSDQARDRIGGLRSRHEPGKCIDLIIHHQQRGSSWDQCAKAQAWVSPGRCDQFLTTCSLSILRSWVCCKASLNDLDPV